uniref:Uncharacterized protein n=1 Tax=Vespula pensylvanica TaxID=30213 RepID=A0A834PB58_VESPE|nr:hypothetical protein H0235_003058 [Vespula pensylvanica]
MGDVTIANPKETDLDIFVRTKVKKQDEERDLRDLKQRVVADKRGIEKRSLRICLYRDFTLARFEVNGEIHFSGHCSVKSRA